jgi:hypothetical protein
LANKKKQSDIGKVGCLVVVVILIIAITLHVASCVKEENHRVDTYGFSLTSDLVDGKPQNLQKSFTTADKQIYYTFNCIDVPAGTIVYIDWYRAGVDEPISHSEFTAPADVAGRPISANISKAKYNWELDGAGEYSIRVRGVQNDKELFVLNDSFEITE